MDLSQDSHIVYERNEIARNGSAGIFSEFAGGQVIRDNVFTEQPIGVILYGSGSGFNQVIGNKFAGNGVGLDLGLFPAAPEPGVPLCCRGVGQLQNTAVSENKFVNNGAAGLLVGVVAPGTMAGSTISDNRFVHNGFDPGGVVDPRRMTVDDRANISIGPGVGDVTLTNNKANGDADYGIEAVGVIDGGGNEAHGNGNPDQCLGVTC